MRIMVLSVIKSIARRVRKGVNDVKGIPVAVDYSISKILYHRNKHKNTDRIKREPNPLFHKRQFVGHGRYRIPQPDNSLFLFESLLKQGFRLIECDVMFTKDNVPVLCHDDCILEFAKDNKGCPVNKKISKLSYKELNEYNFANDDNESIKITKFEDVIVLAKKNKACVEIDLEKIYLGRRKYNILYEIVKRHDMISSVIWEVLPQDIYSILLIDSSVILQLNHTWSENAIQKFKKYQQDAALIILSEWFPGYVTRDYEEIINTGHQNGYIMKCATLNSIEEAQKMLSIGVDLITTDTLTNNQLENLK